MPRNPFYRNPDPLSADNDRYGVLTATDGIWMKDYGHIVDRCGGDADLLASSTLKYSYFCFLNNAPDVGLNVLESCFSQHHQIMSDEVFSSQLYRECRRVCAEFLGRWRVVSGSQWEKARRLFGVIFHMQLEGGNKYWEFIQKL